MPPLGNNPFIPVFQQQFAAQPQQINPARAVLGPFARTQIVANKLPGLLRQLQEHGVVDDIALNNLLASTLGSNLSKDVGEIVADPTGSNQGRGSSGFIDSITRLAAMNDQARSNRANEALQAGQLAAQFVPQFGFQRTQSNDPRFVDFGDPNAGVGRALTNLGRFGAFQQGQREAQQRQAGEGPSQIEQLLEAVLAQAAGQQQGGTGPETTPPNLKKKVAGPGEKVIQVSNDEGTKTVEVIVNDQGETLEADAPSSVPRVAGSAAGVESRGAGARGAFPQGSLVETPAGSEIGQERTAKIIGDMLVAIRSKAEGFTPIDFSRDKQSEGSLIGSSKGVGLVEDAARKDGRHIARGLLAKLPPNTPALGAEALERSPELRELVQKAKEAGFDFDAARQFGTPEQSATPFRELARNASPQEANQMIAFANAVRAGEVDRDVVLGLETNPSMKNKQFRYALQGPNQSISVPMAAQIIRAIQAQDASGRGFGGPMVPPTVASQP